MHVRLEITGDDVLLYCLTGPEEKYDPSEHPEVVAVAAKVAALREEISTMKKLLDPKIAELKKEVEDLNKAPEPTEEKV